MAIGQHPAFAELPTAFTDELGEDGVVLTLSGTVLAAIRGIVRLPEEIDFLEPGQVVAQSFARLRTVDCPGLKDGDGLAFDGRDFRVMNVRDDGHGMTAMELRKPNADNS